MDLQGKVIAVLPSRSGTNARGEWMAQDFVIETHDTYPRKMVFSVFGADRLQRFNVQMGQEILVSFDIDAREYNGRWFNSVRAYDVRQMDPASVASAPFTAPAAAPQPAPQAAPAASDDNIDDLPF
ncbi:MAG: DUF3127 domain-containing protein [Prevotella sp.]|nr:DUF3127 domain-containing protein [Prevotella sp.]